MPRRKVPGADYAPHSIDLRELPADVDDPVVVPAEGEMLDIRTLHNH